MSRASLEKQPQDVAGMFDDVAEKYDVTNDVLSLGQTRLGRGGGAPALLVWPGGAVDRSRPGPGAPATGSRGRTRGRGSPPRGAPNAPPNAHCTRRVDVAAVSPGPSASGRGATLTNIPPERRSTALVRLDTGMLTMTSSRPVIRCT